jgi:hypothetical protein
MGYRHGVERRLGKGAFVCMGQWRGGTLRTTFCTLQRPLLIGSITLFL